MVSYVKLNLAIFSTVFDINWITKLFPLDSMSGFKVFPQSLSPILRAVTFPPSYNCTDASMQSVVEGISNDSNFTRMDLSSGTEILIVQIISDSVIDGSNKKLSRLPIISKWSLQFPVTDIATEKTNSQYKEFLLFPLLNYDILNWIPDCNNHPPFSQYSPM